MLVIQRYSELGLGYENKFQTTSLSTMTLILCRRSIFSIENALFNGFDTILYFGIPKSKENEKYILKTITNIFL